jgi:hypothetical protein
MGVRVSAGRGDRHWPKVSRYDLIVISDMLWYMSYVYYNRALLKVSTTNPPCP